VFGSEAGQKDVFEEVGVPSVDGVFNGYNGTIFAYGQTGSGKSFTMEGGNLYDEKLKGVIPRMFEYLFKKIREADSKIEFSIKCSYLEIYMEKICDLLDGKIFFWCFNFNQLRSKIYRSKRTRHVDFMFKMPLKYMYRILKRCLK
jgi:hypothetical protein